MNKAIVVLSGGQDSVTCMFAALQMGYEVHAITFDYNQRHKLEIEAAKTTALMAGVKSHEIIELGPVLKSTSPLVSDNPLGQYEDTASLPGGVEDTFVPMRNQLFLTIAFNRAVCVGASAIFTGVAQEDYGGYPDCRERFVTKVEIASNEGLGYFAQSGATDRYIGIQAPLMYFTKAETVKLAISIYGCYEALAFSHTAYDGVFPPIGKDHASILRAKGFEEAGVPDPLVLRAVFLELMAPPKTSNYMGDQVNEYYARVHLAMMKLERNQYAHG